MSATFRQESVWCHIDQDEKANTIVMWIEVEPRVAARASVGSRVKAMRETGLLMHLVVVKVDEPAGRLYVVPEVPHAES